MPIFILHRPLLNFPEIGQILEFAVAIRGGNLLCSSHRSNPSLDRLNVSRLLEMLTNTGVGNVDESLLSVTICVNGTRAACRLKKTPYRNCEPKRSCDSQYMGLSLEVQRLLTLVVRANLVMMFDRGQLLGNVSATLCCAAAYEVAYAITKEELEYLAVRVRKLQVLTKQICEEKIASMVQ
jgi:hypothetical protein